MQALTQEGQGEIKKCNVCLEMYEDNIHSHLMNECQKICSLGCEVSAWDKQSSPHLFDHLVHLADLIARLKKDSEKVLYKTKMVDKLLVSWIKSRNLTNRHTEMFAATANIMGCTEEARNTLFKNAPFFGRNKSIWRDNLLIECILSNDIAKLSPNRPSILSIIKETQSYLTKIPSPKFAPLGQMVVKMISDVISWTSFNGKLLWVIGNVNEIYTMGRDINYSGYSPPFFTHRFGYRMCGRIYLKGAGTELGSYVSVYIHLMKGPADELLQWPFNKLIKISIIDQSPEQANITHYLKPNTNSECFSKPVHLFNRGAGLTNFASAETVYDGYRGYVIDSIMGISIEIADAFDDVDDISFRLTDEEPITNQL